MKYLGSCLVIEIIAVVVLIVMGLLFLGDRLTW